MSRMASSCCACATTRRRPEDDVPNVTKRLSSSEWSGSSPVADRGSKNTLAASSNETPCFRRFAVAFRAFHSKRTRTFHLPSVYLPCRALTEDCLHSHNPGSLRRSEHTSELQSLRQ